MPLEPALVLPRCDHTDESGTAEIEATCPRCQQHSRFTSIGEQRWSHEVALRARLPRVTRLFVCGACETTISETCLT